MVLINYVIMCFIFGTTFLAIKIGVDAGAPPFMSAGLRFFLAGLILYLVMMVRGKANLSLLFRKEMLLSSLGLTFGTFSTLYWGEQYVSSGIAAVLSATGPIMVLVIQAYILRESFNRKSLIGCFVGFVGVILLLSSSITFDVSLLWFLGCVVILVGVFSYASGTIYSKKVIGIFKDTSPIALNAAQMLYGGVLLIVLSLFTETVHFESLLSMKALGSLLYLIVIGSMVAHSLYYWLVAKTNPVFPSTWLYISPLIAITVGAIFHHEPISWLMGIGVMTIMIGTVLVNFEALQGLMKKSNVSMEKNTEQVVVKR
jgi:drug/metabolite transporter (DMT)-like permease